jgi:DNA-binding MarR family transcriptional regulator
MRLFGSDCLVMADRTEQTQTPTSVAKQFAAIRTRYGVEPVYLSSSLSAYNRKRFIELKVPFIIPGNQLYLPPLGVDLRERLKQPQTNKGEFSPATQVLVLAVLWNKLSGVITPSAAAATLGYSAMSMTRAFNELETAGLGEHSVQGRERNLVIVEKGRELWDKALPFLSTPVARRFYVQAETQVQDGILAGESALANLTMLAAPSIPTYAYSSHEWREHLAHGNPSEAAIPEPTGIQIEIWKYPPALFANDGQVDSLSLYLSLIGTDDERIQAKIATLIEGMGMSFMLNRQRPD